jgi:hypothetical protein
VTRDRGNYGPLDRQRHGVIGWVADRAVDQTVGAALHPALPTITNVFGVQRGVDRLVTAARGLSPAAHADRTQIGQDLVHTGVDRDRAIAQISTDFRVLASDLSTWLAENQDHPAAKSVASWIAADVTPALAEWGEFVAREKKSWWTKLATSWDTFEAWADRVKQFRSLARAHGVTLQSGEPTSLPKTIWQHTQNGNASEGMAVLGVLKIGALTALGIMGAAGLYTAIRNLRNRGHAPEQHEMLRQIVREEVTAAKRKG